MSRSYSSGTTQVYKDKYTIPYLLHNEFLCHFGFSTGTAFHSILWSWRETRSLLYYLQNKQHLFIYINKINQDTYKRKKDRKLYFTPSYFTSVDSIMPLLYLIFSHSISLQCFKKISIHLNRRIIKLSKYSLQ